MTQAIGQVIAKLDHWLDTVAGMLPNLVAALLILIVFWFIAKLARKVLLRALKRTSPQTVVSDLLATVGAISVFTVGLLVALGVLRLDKAVTSVLAGAGVMGLALGFAFQSIAANFLSGILISVRHPFMVGDLVETNDYFGHISEINLRATVLRTLDGRLVFLPNRDVLEKAIINYTATGVRRVELKVGVSYGEDLERVRDVTLEALRGISRRIKEREPEFYFEEFGSSSINYTFRFWIAFREQPDYLNALSEAVMRIKSAYNREGITIPFPIRTIDLGIKGGVTTEEVLRRFVAPREE